MWGMNSWIGAAQLVQGKVHRRAAAREKSRGGVADSLVWALRIARRAAPPTAYLP